MADENEKIEVHFHEHITGLRERVSKVEAISDFHTRELTEVRQNYSALSNKIDNVERKVDALRSDVISGVEGHKAEVIQLLAAHTDNEERSFKELIKQNEQSQEAINSLRSWMVGVAAGVSFIVALVLFLQKMGFNILKSIFVI